MFNELYKKFNLTEDKAIAKLNKLALLNLLPRPILNCSSLSKPLYSGWFYCKYRKKVDFYNVQLIYNKIVNEDLGFICIDTDSYPFPMVLYYLVENTQDLVFEVIKKDYVLRRK